MEKEKIRLPKINGIVQTKTMSFKIDNENELWLAQERNRSRFINRLIRPDRQFDLLTKLEYHPAEAKELLRKISRL